MKCNISFVLGMVLALGGLAHAAPFQLDDQQMDGVTAGHADVNNHRTVSAVDVTQEAPGGAIVANGSTAAIVTGGEIEMDGSQQDARAVNMVNSAKSLVANGVNVLDAKVSNGQSQLDYNVNQNNYIIQQDATRVASLGSYSRTEGSIYKTKHTTQNLTDKTAANVISDTNVDTEVNIVGQKAFEGQGVSVVGRIDVGLGNSSANVTADVTTDLTNNVSGDGSSTYNVPILGDITFEGTFNMDNEVHVGGGATVDLNLPSLDVAITGGGCVVQGGSCYAKGSDTSTYDVTNNTTEDVTEHTLGPFSLNNATAEYIVVDGSDLQVQEYYKVKLTGGSQQSMRAVNVVNSAGGLVTNGVNVARHTANMTGLLQPVNLVQSNVIMQGN